MSVKTADECRAVIEQKGIAGEVTVYPGQIHGFACRGDLSKEEVKVRSFAPPRFSPECVLDCRD